jgi:hypothetical protein
MYKHQTASSDKREEHQRQQVRGAVALAAEEELSGNRNSGESSTNSHGNEQ